MPKYKIVFLQENDEQNALKVADVKHFEVEHDWQAKKELDSYIKQAAPKINHVDGVSWHTGMKFFDGNDNTVAEITLEKE